MHILHYKRKRGNTMSEPKVTFVNKPNMTYIYDVICEIIGRQNGGEVEYTHNTTLKEECKNAG